MIRRQLRKRGRRTAVGIAIPLVLTLGGSGCMVPSWTGRPGGMPTVSGRRVVDDLAVAKEWMRGSADPSTRRASASRDDPSPPPPLAGVAPSTGALTEIAPAVPPPPGVYPIDLTTSLRLAEVENPVIGEARARIGEALAFHQQARALLFPTLNAGTNYHGHVGNLQRAAGRILSLSEQSLYVGGGARTLAAESVGVPAVQILSPLTNAIFEPLATRQQVDGARFSARATANTVLLEVATLYLDLLGAEAGLEASRTTAREASEVARINLAYAEVGQRPASDGNRAETELRFFQGQVQKAEEGVAVASTRLVRRLHLDPNVRVRPQGDPLAPMTLVDPGLDKVEAVRRALGRRPEIGATGAAVAANQTRLREEIARPFLPTFALGFSGGGFGGGSNLSPPLLGRFAGRTDFDVAAFWTVQNFGFGNLAIQKRQRAAVGQAEAERSRAINRIRREVSAAFASSEATFRQIEVARRELESAEQGFREDLTRTQGAVGRPIEVLDSLKLLAAARLKLIATIVGYDQAQFTLFVAMGSPPPLLGPIGPLPPAPIASPSVAKIAADVPPLPPPAPPPMARPNH